MLNNSTSTSVQARHKKSDRLKLGLGLLVGLINGLVYLFIVPPWQHYDEPAHFEVAWLAAHLNRLPRPGDYDPQMSRQVAISMVKNRFFGDTTSGMPAEGELVRVPGYTQLDEPPAYYLLASLPIRLLNLMGIQDVALQLRAARLGSLLLYLITILCAWGVISELARPSHVLRWMVPLSLALLPGFADLMTAVNNDAGAVAVFSLFLWGAVRLIQRRFSLLNLFWVMAAVILSYFTKVTALYSLVLLPLALLLSVLPGRLRGFAWVGFVMAGAALLALAFSWGDAAWWARNTFQSSATRVMSKQAPVGTHAFRLELPAETGSVYDYQLHQLLVLPKGKNLKGMEVTVGAWVWANRPVMANLPVFNTFSALKSSSEAVNLTPNPQFFAFSFPVEGDAQRNFISLTPLIQALDTPAEVYYDGLVVVPGSWPLDQTPVFDDPSGSSGVWGGQPFQNLLRNASAESSWMRLRPMIDRFGAEFLPDRGANQPSVSLYYLLDVAGEWRFQKLSAQVLFRTFWARFGWGQVPLMLGWSYWLLLTAMLVGIAGAAVLIWRKRKLLPWSALLFLGLAMGGLWLETFLRGSNYPTQLRAIYYPTARYAFPAIIPTMLLLNAGWYEIGRFLYRSLNISDKVLSIFYVAAWVIFDVYAVLSIAQFYYQILA